MNASGFVRMDVFGRLLLDVTQQVHMQKNEVSQNSLTARERVIFAEFGGGG